MEKSSGQRHGAIRHLRLLGLVITGVLALPVAVAQANDTWTGASSSQQWSDPGNWTAGAPTGAAGTLSFPDCAAPASCYTTQNGVTGIAASGLVFANASNGSQYKISGQTLTIGAGGITDTPGHHTTVLIQAPLALSAGQTWKVGAAGDYNSLNLTGGVAGSSSGLTVAFPPLGSGALYVVHDMEVGPVTINGLGGLHIGGPPTSGHPGTVNASDGNLTTVTGGASLVANPGSSIGPLDIASGTLLLGTNPANNVATTLAVSGAAAIDANSTITTFINNNGSTPGIDYSQLSASGDIALAGRLNLGQGPLGPSNSGCASLTPGDVATLFTTSGVLTGTFANAPQDGLITVAACGAGTAPQVRIHYSAHSVTATVGSGAHATATTTTLAPPNPSPAATNQPVTLTATVTAGGTGASTPSGAVQFFDGGATIPGCGSRPLTGGPSGSASATCTVSYAGAGSHSITATYGGDANFGGSSSPATSVIVQPPGSPTPTPTSPTPTPTSPTPTPTSSTPTTSSSPAPPGHSPPASTTRPNSSAQPHAISASTSAVIRVGTTNATVAGRISTGAGAVTWRFQYGRSSAYGRVTRTGTVAAGRRGTVTVSARLRGLSPDVRYYYRLVVYPASRGARAKSGRSLTFMTKANGRLIGPAPQLTVAGQTITVAHGCESAVRCVGRITLTTRIPGVRPTRRATVVCATGGFRIAAHQTASARLTLTPACLSRFPAQPPRSLVVTDTAQPATGQLGLSRQITLVLGQSSPTSVIR